MYNTFVMIYILAVALLLQTPAVRASPLNVRTALFTPADISKRKWSRRDIALLKARVYLQDLIPPLKLTENPEYVRSLSRYIRDCYATVKSFDPQTETILQDAISDVLGGYLKMIALPVTKNGYYSGDVSAEDALQLFEYYDEIKKHLRTHGESWSDQVSNIIYAKNRESRSNPYRILTKIKDPCQKLMYVQTAKQNLSMPMPTIDWDTKIMFVPLTEHPIVNLRSPDVEPVLLKFHQVATACERSISPQKRFQDLFNSWAKDSVIPHLSDEEMYTGFKGILRIIENDNSGVTPSYYEKQSSKSLFGLSTSALVIVIILILELICCIPTLFYTLRRKGLIPSTSTHSRCKRKLKQSKRAAQNLFRMRKKFGKNTSAVNCVDYKTMKNNAHIANSNLGSRFSHSSITDVVTVVEEVCPKKYSSRNQCFQSSYKDTEKDRRLSHHTQISSLPQATSTYSEISIDEASPTISNDTSETIKLSTKHERAFNVVRKSKRFKKDAAPISVINTSPNTITDSQCTTVLGNDNQVNKRNSSTTTADDLKLHIFGDKLWNKAVQSKATKKVDFVSPNISISLTMGERREIIDVAGIQKVSQTQSTQRVLTVLENVRNLESQNSSGVAVTTGTSAVKQTNPQIPKSGKKPARKRSKIPMKIKCNETSRPASRAPSSTRPAGERPLSTHRSMIPKPRRTQDDSAIPTRVKDSKLNITL